MTRRTLAALAALFTATLATTLVIGLRLDQRPDPQPTPAQTPLPSPVPSYNPDATDAKDDQAHDPEQNPKAAWPVVENFGRNFTNTAGGAGPWQTRLTGPPAHPYLTTDLAQQLDTIDVTRVPRGHYTGYKPLKTSTYEIAAKVSYREGWSMVLHLITDGTHWQIYAYDKTER